MSQDNRKEPRFPIGVDVPAQWAPLEEPMWLAASDISAHGIFLDVASPPPTQTMVALGPPNALVRGRVVFVLLPDAAEKLGRSPGIGVQLNLAMDVDAWLLRVAEHRAASLAAAALELELDEGAETPAAAPVEPMAPVAPLAPAVHRGPAPPPLPGSAPLTAPPARAQTPRAMPITAPIMAPRTPAPLADGIRAAIVPAVDKQRSAADAARRMARVPEASDEAAGAEVLIVAPDPRVGELLQAALVADDYTPLIARHGLEALALCVRRRPLIAIVPAAMPRLSAALFLRELRAHDELKSMRVIVIDGSSEEVDSRASARWSKAPDSVQAARRQIDLVAEGLRGQARPPRGKEDARELAAMINALALRWSEAGDYAAAVLALRYVVELMPSSHEYAAFLGWTLFLANAEANGVEALAILERVLRQQPAYAQAWFYKGAILRRRGKVAEGEGLLKRALMYEPGHAGARAELERPAEAPEVEPPASKPAEGGLLGRLFRKP